MTKSRNAKSPQALNPNAPATKVPSLPSSLDAAKLAEAIKKVIEVREGLAGSPLDANPTWRQLVQAGIAELIIDGQRVGGALPGSPVVPPLVIGGGSEEPDLTPPPIPLGVAATSAIHTVLISWNVPVAYTNLAYAEIWRSTADDVLGAIKIGSSSGFIYTDTVGPNSPLYYYWVRFVSRADVEGEFSESVTAQTSAEPGWLLDLLEGQISSSLLDEDLTSSIDAVSSLQEQMITLAAGSGEQFDTFKIWYFDASSESWAGNGTPVLSGGWLRPANHASDAYLNSPSGTAAVGATYPQIKLRIRKVGVPVWEGQFWWRAAAADPWSTTDRVTVAEPTFNDDDIATMTVDMPWTGTIDGIRVDLSGTSTSTDYYEIDWIAIGRASPGASVAALQQEAAIRTTQTGELYAKYTVKIDANGYVSGFGLASEPNNGSVVSTFAVRADAFYIASPSGPSVTPSMPFIVRTTPTTINGQAVAAGVYMRDAFIQNGIITSAKIGLLEVDDAHIADVKASKLTADKLGVGQWISSQSYIAGSQGWRINADGTAEFSGVVVRGTVYATSGLIGGITITSNSIRSAGFSSGGGGFAMYSDGSAEFYNITARGDIRASSVVAGISVSAPVITGGTMNATTMNSVTVNAGSFIGGILQGSGAPDNVINLNATSTGIFLRCGTLTYYGPYAGSHYPVEIAANGGAFFARGAVSGGTLLASGFDTIPVGDRPTVRFLTTPVYSGGGD